VPPSSGGWSDSKFLWYLYDYRQVPLYKRFCFHVTQKFTPLFEYVIIFGLTQFGIHDPCWRLAEVTLLSHYQSHEWIEYIGDIIMQLMQFYCHQYWILLSKWVRNTNLHNSLQSDWKTGARQSVLKINYMWWADWRKVNQLLTYSVIAANVQLMIMLIKL
jgi:hypothetical protein